MNLDHVAHFVPHLDDASGCMQELGFTLTPFSAQSHRSEPGGPLTPAGAANRCIMLKRGYLELLTPTGDTNVAGELRTAIKKYVGPHLIAFGTADPKADYERLDRMGFRPADLIALQREIDTPDGRETARFTVVRVPPETMAEGRIQYCQHHTPELLWQSRWLAHPNCARALNGVILCTADPREAAQRYARYTGLLPHVNGNVWRVDTARGYLLFLDPATIELRLETTPPRLPWIVGCIVESDDVAVSNDYLCKRGTAVHALGSHRLLVKLPASAGGIMIFEPGNSGTLSFG